MKKTMFIVCVLVIAALIAVPAGAAAIYTDSLKSGVSTADVAYGGTYSAAGWSPTAQRDALIWHFSGLTQGAVEFSIKGLNGAAASSLFSAYDTDYGTNTDSQYFTDGFDVVPNKMQLRMHDSSASVLRGYFESNNNNPAVGSSTSNAGTYYEDQGTFGWDANINYRFRVQWAASGGVNNGAYAQVYRDGVLLLNLDGLSYWPVSGMALQPFSAINGNFSVRLGHQSRNGNTAPIGAVYSDLTVFNAVPEPSSLMALGVFGAGALGMIRRRIR